MCWDIEVEGRDIYAGRGTMLLREVLDLSLDSSIYLVFEFGQTSVPGSLCFLI